MNKEIWLFIFFLGLLFFNWPVLEIFRLSLPYYLFSVWVVFIAVTGLLITLKGKKVSQSGNESLTNSGKNRDV